MLRSNGRKRCSSEFARYQASASEKASFRFPARALFISTTLSRVALRTHFSAGANSLISIPRRMAVCTSPFHARIAADAAWSYERLAASAPPLSDYVAFEYAAMDAWYQEDDRVYAHLRDPYHRFDVNNSSRHVIVRHGASVIAESRRPRLLFETGIVPHYYLPPQDVRVDLLERSETLSKCPYKGDGQHWNLTVGANTVQDVAWTLPDPLGEADVLVDFFCFYPTKVEVEVDGERLVE